MKIVIVGPCASGTTTLAENLRRVGYDAHACAQEHSYVPDMWRMSRPDVLIYLDATMDTIRRRRDVSWGEERLAAEKERLAHARGHCNLYLPTDDLTREAVFQRARQFLEEHASAAT
jgi:cytidylate kinase